MQSLHRSRVVTGTATGRACRATPPRRSLVAARAEVTTAAAPPSHAKLVEEAQKLVDLAKADAPQEQLDQQAELLAQLGEAAEANRVMQELNDGNFKGITLTGRTAQRFRTVITLGVLSFNKYQPTDQKIRMMDSEDEKHSGGVFKGPHEGVQQAYILSVPFELVETEKVGDAAESAKPIGITGHHLLIGEYRQADDNPQRLIITFNKLVMKPAPEADLKAWLERLLPHNPTMDPTTGVLELELPPNNPDGWVDHQLMINEFHLTRANYGSRTLLMRVDKSVLV